MIEGGGPSEIKHSASVNPEISVGKRNAQLSSFSTNHSDNVASSANDEDKLSPSLSTEAYVENSERAAGIIDFNQLSDHQSSAGFEVTDLHKIEVLLDRTSKNTIDYNRLGARPKLQRELKLYSDPSAKLLATGKISH